MVLVVVRSVIVTVRVRWHCYNKFKARKVLKSFSRKSPLCVLLAFYCLIL